MWTFVSDLRHFLDLRDDTPGRAQVTLAWIG
jgi:hypothetical protein